MSQYLFWCLNCYRSHLDWFALFVHMRTQHIWTLNWNTIWLTFGTAIHSCLGLRSHVGCMGAPNSWGAGTAFAPTFINGMEVNLRWQTSWSGLHLVSIHGKMGMGRLVLMMLLMGPTGRNRRMRPVQLPMQLPQKVSDVLICNAFKLGFSLQIAGNKY